MPMVPTLQFGHPTTALITMYRLALGHGSSVFILRCRRAHDALTVRLDFGCWLCGGMRCRVLRVLSMPLIID